MKYISMLLLMSCLLFVTNACKTNTNSNAGNAAEPEVAVTVPQFNADSAYSYIQAQVDFGPRVPNTRAHEECGEYLAGKLEEFGAVVTNQFADLIAYDGTILKARNIIGSYNPENKKRILLFAHWDSRPWADNDRDAANHYKPILGANDGASGVGVLLEMARLINQEQPRLGIDIIFFDAEDYGTHREYTGPSHDNSWALGSAYWARYPHVEGYNARFGILLDMVGAKDATFYKEGYSEEYARHINKKVWDTARKLGHSKYFVNERTGSVTDDHVPVNQVARIPSIDIVPDMRDAKYSTFGDFWHTVNDDMSVIDKNTLRAVGETVLTVVYNEK